MMRKLLGVILLLLAVLFTASAFRTGAAGATFVGLVLALVLALLGLRMLGKNKQAANGQPAASEQPAENPDPQPAPVAPRSITIPDIIKGAKLAYHYDDVQIEADAAADLSACQIGDRLGLSMSGDTAIITHNGHPLGALPRNRLTDMARDWIRRDEPTFVALRNVDPAGRALQIVLAFYRDILADAQRRGLTPVKLSGTANADAQEMLAIEDAGTVCELEYDYDRERWAVSDASTTLGYLPAKYNEEALKNAQVVLAEVDQNDKMKYEAWVYIFE